MYGPLVLLTISLIMRIWGDLAGLYWLRRWGGLLNATAILIFVILSAWIIIQVKREML